MRISKILRALCAALLIAACCAVPRALARLSAPEAAEDGFAGVVRVWVYEEMTDAARWLYRQSASFERRNPGVHVFWTLVSEADLRAFDAGTTPAPDALVFPPGMLADARGLAPLDVSADFLGALSGKASAYACPVALDGYLWLDTGKDGDAACPLDAPYAAYSAALVASRAGWANAQDEPKRAGDGLSLGLTEPSPTPRPAPARADLPLPALARSETAAADFLGGERASLLAGPAELRQYEARLDAGRAPDAEPRKIASPFTDRIAFAAVVSGADAKRVDAARALIRHLLTDDAQAALSGAGLFRVTRGEPLYTAGDLRGALEASLTDEDLLTPPAFGNAWRAEAARLAESGSGWAAMDALRAACGG